MAGGKLAGTGGDDESRYGSGQEYVSDVRLCKLPLTREIVCGLHYRGIKYITRQKGRARRLAKNVNAPSGNPR